MCTSFTQRCGPRWLLGAICQVQKTRQPRKTPLAQLPAPGRPGHAPLPWAPCNRNSTIGGYSSWAPIQGRQQLSRKYSELLKLSLATWLRLALIRPLNYSKALSFGSLRSTNFETDFQLCHCRPRHYILTPVKDLWDKRGEIHVLRSFVWVFHLLTIFCLGLQSAQTLGRLAAKGNLL